MYSSYKNQIKDAELDAKNESILLSDILRLEREQKLMLGIQPLEIEALSPDILKETAISLLKLTTFQPNKVYSFLYGNNNVNAFIKYNYDFRKMNNKLTNLSYDEFVEIWNKFKIIKSNDLIKEEKQKRDQGIMAQEGKERKKIENTRKNLGTKILEQEFFDKVNKPDRDVIINEEENRRPNVELDILKDYDRIYIKEEEENPERKRIRKENADAMARAIEEKKRMDEIKNKEISDKALQKGSGLSRKKQKTGNSSRVTQQWDWR